jgi:hypothetical protein
MFAVTNLVISAGPLVSQPASVWGNDLARGFLPPLTHVSRPRHGTRQLTSSASAQYPHHKSRTGRAHRAQKQFGGNTKVRASWTRTVTFPGTWLDMLEYA